MITGNDLKNINTVLEWFILHDLISNENTRATINNLRKKISKELSKLKMRVAQNGRNKI